MSRSPSRLRRLLDLRRREETAARVLLAQSLQRAASISEEVRARTDALESVIAGAAAPDPHHRNRLDVLGEMVAPAILAARAAEGAATSAVIEIRSEWNRAAVRLKGLERIDEKHAEEIRDREGRDAARHRDDAMTSRLDKETR